MNHIIYAKFPNEKRYGAMNIAEGRVGVSLVYATLFSDLERAKEIADKLPAACIPGMTFQVRQAVSKNGDVKFSKVVYQTESECA